MAIQGFIKIDGIDGESTDKEHKNWIEVIAFTHDLNQPVSAASATGGRSAAGIMISDFVFHNYMDAATPTLNVACCEGRHIDKAVLELCKASGDKHAYMKYTFENIIISSCDIQSGGEKPVEEVRLNFGKITWEYTPIDSKGKPQSPKRTGWTREDNALV